MACTDNGSSRKLLIILAVLALAAGGLSPLVLAGETAAATALDWTDSRGPGNGDAPAFAWDDTHKILYRATSGRGVWKYQGGAWTSLGGAVSTFGITSLAYGGGLLYAGTNGQGVWCYDVSAPDPKWSDTSGGVSTWRIVSLTWSGNKLYAGCLDRSVGEIAKGVWCYDPASILHDKWSDTGGAVVSLCKIYSLAWDANNNLLYGGSPNSGLFCYDPDSPDADKWTDLRVATASAGITSLAYYPVNQRLYAGNTNPSNGDFLGVWCYEPSGATWTDTNGGVSTFKINAFAYDVSHNLLYAGTAGQGVWCYDPANPGAGWTNTGGGVSTFNVPALVIGGDKLYAGCYDTVPGYEGVWSYDPADPGTGWINTEGGVNTFRIYSLAWSGDRFYASCWDSTGWGVEGLWCYDPSNPEPDKWSAVSMPGTITLRIYSMARGGNKLYASCHSWPTEALEGVWCYDPSSDSWSDTGGGVSTLYISSFAYDAGHGGLYAGTGSQGVWYADARAAPTVTSVSPNSGVAGTTVSVTDLRGTGFYGTPTVKLKKSGQTDIAATNVSVVSSTKITCRFNLANAALGTWNLYVENPDGKNVTKSNAFTIGSASATWYLAEGTTAWGFSTYISIQNPNASAVHAAITYMTGSGNVSGGTITLPAKSQTTVNPADKLGNQDFSTLVQCKDKTKSIAVDRTMSWTGQGAASPEGHSSVGVTAPAKTWYLPEGSSAWGFETWLLIQNPNGSVANCTVTYMIEGETPVTKAKTVPANARQSYNMFDDIGAKNASIKVVSNIPVIPERAMYRNNKREGHDSIGTTTAANDYYMAEGTTAWGFTTWVLIQNPASDASDVTITYMTPSGKKVQPSFSLPGNSRKTIKVNDVPGMGNTDFSTAVHGSKPIIAERAMYWDNGTGEACHDSIGMDSSHTTFYLPDGQTSEGRETWTLVQNPNTSAVNVEVTYLKAGGGTVSLTSTIPANSRKTFNMAEKVPSGRASITVTCKTAGKKIMVERAMYWNNRGAGTDTIGGFSD